MAHLFDPATMSKEILCTLFRDGLLAAAIDPSFALEDPKVLTRPPDSKFVVTAFPTSEVYMPFIVVLEMGAPGGRIDSHHSGVMRYAYQVQIVIRSQTNTLLFPIRDAIREWIQKKWKDLKDAGLYDLQVIGSGPSTWDETTLSKEVRITLEMKVYTTGG